MVFIEGMDLDIPILVATFKVLASSGTFWLLIVLMLFDIITGKYIALLNRDYSSSTGTRGLIKHSTVLMLVILVSITFRITDQIMFAVMFKSFYILEYITSIIENLTLLGVKLPSVFVDRLRITRESYDEKVERSLRHKDDV